MESLAPDIQRVYPSESFVLYRGDILPVAVRAYVASERLFGKVCAAVERSAYSNTDVNGRAGARAGFFNGFNYRVYDALDALRGFEHIQRRHVFASEALRHKSKFNFVARDELGVNGGWGVVGCVPARYRVAYRLSEIPVGISPPHSVVHSLGKGLARKEYLVSYFEHYDGHSRVLADGHGLFARDFAVLYKLPERKFCRSVVLGGAGAF